MRPKNGTWAKVGKNLLRESQAGPYVSQKLENALRLLLKQLLSVVIVTFDGQEGLSVLLER